MTECSQHCIVDTGRTTVQFSNSFVICHSQVRCHSAQIKSAIANLKNDTAGNHLSNCFRPCVKTSLFFLVTLKQELVIGNARVGLIPYFLCLSKNQHKGK